MFFIWRIQWKLGNVVVNLTDGPSVIRAGEFGLSHTHKTMNLSSYNFAFNPQYLIKEWHSSALLHFKKTQWRRHFIFQTSFVISDDIVEIECLESYSLQNAEAHYTQKYELVQ